MFEFGLGVILAALFVAAYFLITTFFRRERDELGGLHPRVTLNPMDTTHSISSGRSPQALTSGTDGGRQPDGSKHEDAEDKGSKL